MKDHAVSLNDSVDDLTMATTVRVLADDPTSRPLPLIAAGGRAWAVAWPGTGSHLRSLHRLSLTAGATSVRMTHPMEAVYYVMSGTAEVDGAGTSQTLSAGAMIFIQPRTSYVFRSDQPCELVGGPCPADPGLYDNLDHEIAEDGKGAIDVLHRDQPDLLMPMIARDARLVVWAGRGSQTANMNYVDMQPGERNVPHIHAGSEDTLYVLDGEGTIEDLTNGTEIRFAAPCAVHVPVGLVHAVKADRGVRVESVGGPAPADWNMLVKVGGYRMLGS